MRFRVHLAATASLFAFAAAAPALAQPTTAPATPPASATPAGPGPATSEASVTGDNGGRVEEVVVTAQRRSENLQNVPIAVTAFSPRLLEAAQIRDTTDLVRFTPSVTGGLNTGTGSALTFFVRGLGSTEQIATFDVPVATYIDEIYVARQNANAVSLFDVEQVEVLRGPQGTLFGRNTTGGAVSITTRKPAKEFGGFVEGSYGSFNRGMIRGSVDVPINDKVLTKFSAFHLEDDGYGKSIVTGERLNGEDSTGIRAAVRLLSIDRLTWDLSFDYVDQTKTTLGSAPFDPEYKSRTGLRVNSDCGDDINRDYLATQRGNCANSRVAGVTSNLAYRLDGATLSFITGYRVLDENFAVDFFNGRGPYGGYVIGNEIRNHQITQEAKIDGDLFGGRLKYVAGVFYLYETTRTNEIDYGPGFGAGLLADWRLSNDAESVAVYAQGDYKLTDKLTATVGARYTNETKSFGYDDAVKASYPAGVLVTVPPLASRPTTANVIRAGIPTSREADKLTPRFALSYQIDPDHLLYASVTNGFKSGGWNTRVTNIIAVTTFAPELAWSYEFGARTQWFDRRLRANLTLYHEDISRLQLLSGSGNGQFVTRNAGDLEATGLEWDISASPVSNLDVFFTGQVSDKNYANIPLAFGTGGVPCNSFAEPTNCTTTRDEPVRFPDWQLSLGATYRVPLPQLGGVLSFNGAYTYSSRYWSSTYNDTPFVIGVPYNSTTPITVPLSHVPVTNLFNFGIVFRSDKRWEVALECSNCTGEYYPTSSLFGLGYYNDPQRLTVRAKYSF